MMKVRGTIPRLSWSPVASECETSFFFLADCDVNVPFVFSIFHGIRGESASITENVGF